MAVLKTLPLPKSLQWRKSRKGFIDNGVHIFPSNAANFAPNSVWSRQQLLLSGNVNLLLLPALYHISATSCQIFVISATGIFTTKLQYLLLVFAYFTCSNRRRLKESPLCRVEFRIMMVFRSAATNLYGDVCTLSIFGEHRRQRLSFLLHESKHK